MYNGIRKSEYVSHHTKYITVAQDAYKYSVDSFVQEQVVTGCSHPELFISYIAEAPNDFSSSSTGKP